MTPLWKLWAATDLHRHNSHPKLAQVDKSWTCQWKYYKGIKRYYAGWHDLPENKVDQKSENVQFCIFANGNILHHKTCFYLTPTKKKRKNRIKYTAKKNFGCKQKISPISSIQYMSFIYIKGYHL